MNYGDLNGADGPGEPNRGASRPTLGTALCRYEAAGS
jgi:hypothetical protein